MGWLRPLQFGATRALVCVLVAGCGALANRASAESLGFVAAVKVPRVGGDLSRVYRLLARDGFTVSVPRRVVVRAAANPAVIGERPAAGSQVAPGSTVTLVVACCKPSSVARTRSRRPVGLVGRNATAAVRWAKLHHVAWRLMLAPLKRATRGLLLDNYVVRRAVLTPTRPTGHDRSADPVLEVTASQNRTDIGAVVPERVPPCEPTAQTRVLAQSGRALLVEEPDLGSDPPFPSYAACDRETGRQQLLYQVQVNGDGYYYYLQGAAAAGGTVALAIQYQDKYENCSTTVDIYDFARSVPLTTYQAGCTNVSGLVVDDQGFAAWLATDAEVTGPHHLFVHDDTGTRQLDSGVIANVQLSGNTVSWTNDGAPLQATLT
jgi:hypothetical protein